MPQQFYILDGTNFFFRYFFAPFRDLSIPCPDCEEDDVCETCGGTGREPTKAVWLFTKMLLGVLRDKKPSRMAVVFDGDRAALRRRKLYPEYKGNRKQAPEGSKPQLLRIKQIVTALGLKVIQCSGYEADDAIATLAVQNASPRQEVIILSRDKDLSQLCVNPDIFCFDPLTLEWRAKKTAGKRYGVKTRQLVDYFVLTGDASDNVPGVGGFGEKTAAQYLGRYKNIEDMVIGATMGHLPRRLAENLIKAQASGWLNLSRRLIRLDTKIKLDVAPGELTVPSLDLRRAEAIFKVLRFKGL